MRFLIFVVVLCAIGFGVASARVLSATAGSFLITNGVPFTTDIVPFRTTNELSDGSIIKIQAVSYGVVHRIPSSYGQPRFFKSASPTIMFTTSRQAPTGHFLNDLWTQAEALDTSGSWYPLRRRTEPRPVKEGFQDEPNYYEGIPPSEMWETWEFPRCPKPSAWLRVRIWATLDSTNVSSVECKLPNDEAWRKRTAKEETSAFHPQEWLNGELFRAAYGGNVDYVKDLIVQGANPNSSDSQGMSALAIACQDDHAEVVSYLLDHGADVNAHGKGEVVDRTALMAAASNGAHVNIVRLLVDKGADVNTRGELGWTALIWAAREGDIECVKYLLSKGADPHIKALDDKTVIELTEETDSANRFAIVEILKKTLAAH
jgi:hypothetical protein